MKEGVRNKEGSGCKIMERRKVEEEGWRWEEERRSRKDDRAVQSVGVFRSPPGGSHVPFQLSHLCLVMVGSELTTIHTTAADSEARNFWRIMRRF
jgi:hypothetical protein